MKILICGLPGSGKSTLAEPLSVALGAVWINADAVRERYDDWDFSPDGRMRQASRMPGWFIVVIVPATGCMKLGSSVVALLPSELSWVSSYQVR